MKRPTRYDISVAIASTCYWEACPPTYVDVCGPWSGRLDDLKGCVFRWRTRDGETGFEAQLLRDSLLSYGSKPESLYRGPSLDAAIAALNARLNRLELDEGYVTSPRNSLPARLDPAALVVKTLETETFIDRELTRQRDYDSTPRRRRGGTPKL